MSSPSVVRVVVPPCPAHSFGIFVVRHDVVVVGELFLADRTHFVLFDNLPVDKTACGAGSTTVLTAGPVSWRAYAHNFFP
jgi:hypothetical protein